MTVDLAPTTSGEDVRRALVSWPRCPECGEWMEIHRVREIVEPGPGEGVLTRWELTGELRWRCWPPRGSQVLHRKVEYRYLPNGGMWTKQGRGTGHISSPRKDTTLQLPAPRTSPAEQLAALGEL